MGAWMAFTLLPAIEMCLGVLQKHAARACPAQGDKQEYDRGKLEASLELITRTIRDQGPFDGIVGACSSNPTITCNNVLTTPKLNMPSSFSARLPLCTFHAGWI